VPDFLQGKNKNGKEKTKMRRPVLFFFLMVACCSSAFAALTVRIEYENGQATFESCSNARNFELTDGEDILAEGSWNLTSDMDPYVESSVSLTNPTSRTQTYTMIITTDVLPSMSSCFYSGYVSSSLKADSGGGYFSTVGSTPLYLGMIDDSGVLPLYSSISLNNTGAGTTTAIAEQSAGPLPGGAVNETISIQHKFKLGAGDTVILNGYFEVVPEPATICLLGLGALSLIRRKK
jgi:hypothetical protein